MKKLGTKFQLDLLESRLSHLNTPASMESQYLRAYVPAAYPLSKAVVVCQRALQIQTESFLVMKKAASHYEKEVMDKEATV